MKSLFLSMAFLLLVSFANAQTINWTWQGGSSSENQQGIYGTKGVANFNNTPNAREGSSCWTDSEGNFWQFGGYGGYSPYFDNGVNYYFNDLWMYNPKTYEWTWVGGSDNINQAGVYGTLGVASATNWPGSRQGAVTWVDATGTVWLFGGNGYDSSASYIVNPNNSYLNDLWKLNMKTMQWTWVSGSPSTNLDGSYGRQNSATGGYPGGRTFASGSVDASGNLWLCGGLGFDQVSTGTGDLNDLWEFIPSTASWIWIGGSNQGNQLGTYGTLGIGSITNTPPSRHGATSFFDASGKLWLFGGDGYSGEFNDMWNYDITTHIWTWINGSDQGDMASIAPKEGVYAAGNSPSGRQGSYVWLDSAKNLWLFGGYGRGYLADSINVYPGNLNDLWEYSITSNEWAFTSGSLKINQAGVYGIIGAPSTTQFPGTRVYGSFWKDNMDNFWIFGGTGSGNIITAGQFFLNDVWEISAPANALAVKLIAFQASLNGSNVLLSWSTATEINNKGFEIFRSVDGTNFTSIGFVAGGGNSDLLLNYQFTDKPGLNGNVFYRLKQVDVDGKFAWSNIVSVNLKSQVLITFMPNPAHDFINISSPVNVKEIRLVNTGGQLVKVWNSVSPNAQLSLSGIAKGIYMIQIINDKFIQTQRIVVE
jgi:hypothetical protein